MLRFIPGISQKVLAENLLALEKDGIIDRMAFDETPSRVEYSMTGLGQSMRLIIKSMEMWGLGYQKVVQETELCWNCARLQKSAYLFCCAPFAIIRMTAEKTADP